jgi:diguanylate cyclase (GGDEF)-like protein
MLANSAHAMATRAGGRILLVERDPRSAAVLRWLLRDHGHAVTAPAADVDVIVDAVVAESPDVLLLDADAVDTKAVIARTRASERARDVRVMLTRTQTVASWEWLDGADDWICKPYRVQELVARIDRQLAARAQLVAARGELASTVEELERVRATSAGNRRLVDMLETTRADNRRLEALATTDALTHVLNRRAFLDRLASEVDRARRFRTTVSLLLVDADRFKQINDTAGHLAGDDVLRQLALLLSDAARRVDVVARYGGEEFVLILPETTADGALIFSERLRERVSEHAFDVGAKRPLQLTVSIGLATFPDARVTSTDDLFARADEALYRAKAGGRNRVCVS